MTVSRITLKTAELIGHEEAKRVFRQTNPLKTYYEANEDGRYFLFRAFEDLGHEMIDKGYSVGPQTRLLFLLGWREEWDERVKELLEKKEELEPVFSLRRVVPDCCGTCFYSQVEGGLLECSRPHGPVFNVTTGEQWFHICAMWKRNEGVRA